MSVQFKPEERQFWVRAAPLIMELCRRETQRQFYRMFPDEDTILPGGEIMYARAKYPRQLEFFEAGKEYSERCFMAANRCITPWTWVETDLGAAPSAEAWTEEGRTVQAWGDGSRHAVRPQGGFLKGIEPAFRVVMVDGRFFDCSRKHQVLSASGWIALDQLVSLSSGLRLWHRRADYQANCVAGGYLDGQQPHPGAGSAQARLPSQGGAQKYVPLIFGHGDEAARILQCIRASPRSDRLTTRDDLQRLSGLFSLFSAARTSKSVLRLSESIRDVQQLCAGEGALLRQDGAPLHDQHSGGVCLASDRTQDLDGSCRRIGPSAARLTGALFHDAQHLGGSVQQWSRDAAHIPIFYPFDHPSLEGGGSIAAIVPLGLQPIIDVQVPFFNNYCAGGVVHHNCGKTIAGAYEVACHLTGEYPHWWAGKRFSGPVRFWAAGKTNETTRDIVQATLCGNVVSVDKRRGFDGTGIIPGRALGQVSWKQGVPDLADVIKVKHVSGRWSKLGMKSYQQGRGSFEGTAQHGIWLDEECPEDVYNECLIRTATTRGIVLLTFTPLDGMTETVQAFLPEEMRPADLDEDLLAG